MTTSKGTIQGYNGVASVDKKHQITIDAQAFGAGQEQHPLQPVLEAIQEKYQRLGLSENTYQENIIVTADTGFANEVNGTAVKNITSITHNSTIKMVTVNHKAINGVWGNCCSIFNV